MTNASTSKTSESVRSSSKTRLSIPLKAFESYSSLSHSHSRSLGASSGSSDDGDEDSGENENEEDDDFSAEDDVVTDFKLSHTIFTSNSLVSNPTTLSDDENDDDVNNNGDEDDSETIYNEEDHRRLLFGMSRGRMNPQLELALRLMDEMNGAKSTGLGSDRWSGEEDEVEENVEGDNDDEDLDSVEEDFERGYTGFSITRGDGIKKEEKEKADEELETTEDPDPNPYDAFKPEPGLGRIQRWLEGLHVGEMVA